MSELRERLAALASEPSRPLDLAAVRRRAAGRRRRRLATRAGAITALVAVIAAVIVAVTARPGQTPVATTGPSVTTPTTPPTTPPSSVPARHLKVPPSPLNCPSTSTTTTTTPSVPPLTVTRQYGALYAPPVVTAAGPATMYVSGPAAGCDPRYLSSYLGLDRTTDTGRHFTRVALPEDAVGGPAGIGFGTPSFGYALGQGGTPSDSVAVVWITTTAAATWQRLPLPAGAGIVAATATRSAAYFLADHCHRLTCGCTPGCTLLRVPAGTTNAVTVPFPDFTPPPGSGLTAAGGVTITASGRHLWVAASDTNRLLYSPDDGQHFTALPITNKLAACAITAVAPTFLWATCSHQAYRSTNAGRSFTLATSDKATVGWDPITPQIIYRETRPNPVGAISLQRSTNAGRSFAPLTDPAPTFACNYTFASPTNGLAFCGQQMGMTTGPIALYRTSDGGHTWQQTAPA